MTAMIVQFPEHRRARCFTDCEGCPLCNGGLFICATCGGAEASLTTHCPQYRCDTLTLDEVQAGRLDFVRGKWVQCTKRERK